MATIDDDEIDTDETDDDEIWTGICRVAGKHAGVTVEQARAILEEG